MLAIGSVLQPCVYTNDLSLQLIATRPKYFEPGCGDCEHHTAVSHPLLRSAYFTDADDNQPCFACSEQCMNVVNAC